MHDKMKKKKNIFQKEMTKEEILLNWTIEKTQSNVQLIVIGVSEKKKIDIYKTQLQAAKETNKPYLLGLYLGFERE